MATSVPRPLFVRVQPLIQRSLPGLLLREQMLPKRVVDGLIVIGGLLAVQRSKLVAGRCFGGCFPIGRIHGNFVSRFGLLGPQQPSYYSWATIFRDFEAYLDLNLSPFTKIDPTIGSYQWALPSPPPKLATSKSQSFTAVRFLVPLVGAISAIVHLPTEQPKADFVDSEERLEDFHKLIQGLQRPVYKAITEVQMCSKANFAEESFVGLLVAECKQAEEPGSRLVDTEGS